ncbi:MAG: cation transporter [candidate division Zixibacteria bacterium]|nr:cation transporter [candidate division Zixibacteria bacterium]
MSADIKANNTIDRTDNRTQLASGLKVTWVGLAANLVLVVIKFWGGIVGRSQALVADAVHSVSDLFSDVVVLFGLKWGRKVADEEHPYGHARIETISSLIVGFLLLVVALGIAYRSVLSIYNHKTSSPELLTIYVAALSIVVKEALYWYTVRVGRHIRSIALVGNAWHHRSDALSSVAVLIGVAAAHFNPAWHLADSYAALIVSFFIFKIGGSLTWSAFKELADTAPDKDILRTIEKKASDVLGVRQVHDLKARYSGRDIFVDIHIVVDPNITVRQGHAIAKEVEYCLVNEIRDISRVTIHIDPDIKKDV